MSDEHKSRRTAQTPSQAPDIDARAREIAAGLTPESMRRPSTFGYRVRTGMQKPDGRWTDLGRAVARILAGEGTVDRG